MQMDRVKSQAGPSFIQRGKRITPLSSTGRRGRNKVISVIILYNACYSRRGRLGLSLTGNPQVIFIGNIRPCHIYLILYLHRKGYNFKITCLCLSLSPFVLLSGAIPFPISHGFRLRSVKGPWIYYTLNAINTLSAVCRSIFLLEK